MFKKISSLILRKFQFLRRIKFTQTTVLLYGIVLLFVLIMGVLGWDAYLFIQSIAPQETIMIKKSKEISLTSQDIDDAIHILDDRQEHFTTLLKDITSTTTITF